MNAVMRAAPSAAPWRQRVLCFPMVPMAIALLVIALPFAAVAIPFNMFVVDTSLKKAGAFFAHRNHSRRLLRLRSSG